MSQVVAELDAIARSVAIWLGNQEAPRSMLVSGTSFSEGGRTGLMVRASDSGSGDPGSILGRVGVFVSLSKRHLLPKSTGNTQE